VIPVLTAAQMRDCDARAIAESSHEAVLARAGVAVGQVAAAMLGGCYGRRVLIVAGPGLNGTDGRLAGEYLERRGAKVEVCSAIEQPSVVRGVDLYIDAAFGLGCSRPYVAPRVDDDVAVLAVDLPSGVNSDSGELLGEPVWADVTVALGALKPAHLVGDSAERCGTVVLNTLGMSPASNVNLVEDDDLVDFVRTARSDHKWLHALYVAAGSPHMRGAAALVCDAALASGASMIRLRPFGSLSDTESWPDEVVLETSDDIDQRCRAVVVGPGLSTDSAAQALADRVVSTSTVPIVVDADGISKERLALRQRDVPVIVTPHGGELRRLLDQPSGNALMDAHAVASQTGVTVLLKGPVTVVASPSGETLLVTSGTPALATAGTGDVLAGVIGAGLARGLAPLQAAGLGAHLHGLAGQLLAPYGQASRMDDAIRQVLRELDHAN